MFAGRYSHSALPGSPCLPQPIAHGRKSEGNPILREEPASVPVQPGDLLQVLNTVALPAPPIHSVKQYEADPDDVYRRLGC